MTTDHQWALELFTIRDRVGEWTEWCHGSLEECLTDLFYFWTGGYGESFTQARLISPVRGNGR